MAIDALTIVNLTAIGIGMVLSGIVIWIITCVQREEWPIPVMFYGGSCLIAFPVFIGLRWDMDPSTYPAGYCKTSSILYNLGAFMMTTCGVTLTITTWNAVWHARRGRFEQICRPWQIPSWLKVFFVGYPLVGLCLFGTLNLYFDAIGPEGRWICDVVKVDKLWIRLFGYGGLDVLVTIPAFFATLSSIWNLWYIHAQPEFEAELTTFQRTRYGDGFLSDSDDDTELNLGRVRDTPPNPDSDIRITLATPTPAYAPSSAFAAASPRRREHDLVPASRHHTTSTNSVETSGSDASLATADLARWSSLGRPQSNTKGEVSATETAMLSCLQADRNAYSMVPGLPGQEKELNEAVIGSPRSDVKSLEVPSTFETSENFYARGESTVYRKKEERPKTVSSPEQSEPNPRGKRRHIMLRAVRHQPKLLTALWRIMFFDIFFTAIEVLAAITSLRAIATGIPPQGYNTAFFAVVVGIFGPAIVFGTTPLVLHVFIPMLKKKKRAFAAGRSSQR